MPGFDRDEFWKKVLELYYSAKENNYLLRLNEEEIKELKSIYIDTYISDEQLIHLDEEQLMKKLMTGLVSVYKMEKDSLSHYGEVVEMVKTVKYDGQFLYIYFGKISPVKLRRMELGKSQKQIAERIGCHTSTIKNCEDIHCNLSRQPEALISKLASELECEVDDLM